MRALCAAPTGSCVCRHRGPISWRRLLRRLYLSRLRIVRGAALVLQGMERGAHHVVVDPHGTRRLATGTISAGARHRALGYRRVVGDPEDLEGGDAAMDSAGVR